MPRVRPPGGEELFEFSLDIPAGHEDSFDAFELTITADAGSAFNQTGDPAEGVIQPSEDSGFSAYLTAPAAFGGQDLVALGIDADTDTAALLEGTLGSLGSNDVSDQGDYLVAQAVMTGAGGSGAWEFRYIDDGVLLGVVTGTFGGASAAAVPEPATLALALLGAALAGNRQSPLAVATS